MDTNTAYSALDRSTKSIRLLQFTKDKAPDEIKCVVKTYDISDAIQLQFVALSYVWGGPQPCREIYFNGSPFPVRENLYQALCVLQDMTIRFSNDCPTFQLSNGAECTPNYFWIDAICINQSDLLERGHQVNIMKDIFSGAACVVSWLGPAFTIVAGHMSSSEAMRLLRFIWNGNVNHAQRTAIGMLSTRDYWERIWIVQEFVLAKEVLLICGRDATWWKPEFWEVLEAAPRLPANQAGVLPRLPQNGLWKSAMATLCEARVDAWHGAANAYDEFPEKRMSLMGLLDRFSRWKCSDVRDRIYGLLSLATGQEARTLRADYTITERQLYYRVVRHTIRTHTLLELKDCRDSLTEALGIPHDFAFCCNEIPYSAISTYASYWECAGIQELENALLSDRWTKFDAERFLRRTVADIDNLIAQFETDEKHIGIEKWRELSETTDRFSQDFYNRIVRSLHGFPREEDMETWECFRLALLLSTRFGEAQ